ncbi:hypothetical protein CEXT_752261 [Caerostris extrusa]|uniref:Uncharacterized protein n=1 Tax=Caerostris extrusa TaxID=172846 RepID=A0AAV4QIR9_CAEEX|nr:hypothetical protein CEXT_752261 [Caerostris extrusa]
MTYISCKFDLRDGQTRHLQFPWCRFGKPLTPPFPLLLQLVIWYGICDAEDMEDSVTHCREWLVRVNCWVRAPAGDLSISPTNRPSSGRWTRVIPYLGKVLLAITCR